MCTRVDARHDLRNPRWEEHANMRMLLSAVDDAVRVRSKIYTELLDGRMDTFKDASRKVANPTGWVDAMKRPDKERFVDARQIEDTAIQVQNVQS